jgi:hypothetical protein
MTNRVAQETEQLVPGTYQLDVCMHSSAVEVRTRTLLLLLLVLVGCRPSQPVCRPSAVTVRAGQEQVDATLPVFPRPEAAGISRRYATSFETLEEFSDFYLVPQNYLGTSWHELSTAVVHSGERAHRGWLDGWNDVVPGKNTNHRAYPTIQLFKQGEPYADLVRVELWVWLDVEPVQCRDGDWFSFATLTSYADVNWFQSQLINLDSQGFVHLMHVPTQGKQVHDIFQTNTVHFPTREWVKLTALIDYSTDNAWRSPHIAVWQNEQLVSAARFSPRVDPTTLDRSLWPACLAGWDGRSVEAAEAQCQLDFRGGVLSQAHFGLYAAPLLTTGQVFNDDLEVLELKR